MGPLPDAPPRARDPCLACGVTAGAALALPPRRRRQSAGRRLLSPRTPLFTRLREDRAHQTVNTEIRGVAMMRGFRNLPVSSDEDACLRRRQYLWRKEQKMEHEDVSLQRHNEPVAVTKGSRRQSGRRPQSLTRSARRHLPRNAVSPRHAPVVAPFPVGTKYPAPRLPVEPDPVAVAREHLEAVATCRARRAKFLARLRKEVPVGGRGHLRVIARETQERHPNPNRVGQQLARVHARLKSLEELLAARGEDLPGRELDTVKADRDRLWLLAKGLVQIAAMRSRKTPSAVN